MVNTVLLCASIYVASTVAMWKWSNLAYSKKGIMPDSKPSIYDVIFTVLPVANTLATVLVWLFHWPLRRVSKPWDMSKFFNL